MALRGDLQRGLEPYHPVTEAAVPVFRLDGTKSGLSVRPRSEVLRCSLPRRPVQRYGWRGRIGARAYSQATSGPIKLPINSTISGTTPIKKPVAREGGSST